MPSYDNSDLYGDGPEAAPSAGGQGDEREMDADGATATIPKSLFAGKDPQPGQEWVFEVVRVHEDEVEIKYASGKGDKEPEGKAKPDAEMQSLMES